MRIVTSDATYSRIAAVSAAIEDSIRLITQVVHPPLLRHEQCFFKTDVAGAANFLRQLICIQFRRIEYLEICAARLDGHDVFLARPMTTLASNSRHQVIELQLRRANRRG